MPGSARYKDLESALKKLRTGLLPKRFEPTGTYARAYAVHLRAVSFRLLMHAEIESFLEDRASELASVAWMAWKSARLTTDPIVALLAFAGLESSKAPSKLGGDPLNQKAYDDMAVVLERANSVWRYDHKNNHGVKEPNVLSLFLPLGISSTSLDPVLLADLSSYGALRGEVAHQSSAFVTNYADPQVEYKKARALVADLTKLDEAVDAAVLRVNSVKAALSV